MGTRVDGIRGNQSRKKKLEPEAGKMWEPEAWEEEGTRAAGRRGNQRRRKKWEPEELEEVGTRGV